MRSSFYSPRELSYEFTSTTFRNHEGLRSVLRVIVHWLGETVELFVANGRRRRSLSLLNCPLARIYYTGILSPLLKLEELDTAFWRAEKIPELRDVLTGIIEVSIHPALCRVLAIIRVTGLGLVTYFHAFDDVDVDLLRAIVPDATIAVPDGTISAPDFESAFIAFISAIVLSVVYQYLIGYVDRGGTKTYNSGSLEFRATYVSLLLFQGAYVWIKFRDVAPKRTVYRKSRIDAIGRRQYYGKYEPRFKPPREKDVVTGAVLTFDCLPLGGYNTHRDAEIVCQIAGFYYGRDGGTVELEDGFQFPIPVMCEQERGLRGKEKRKWVSGKAKAVFKELKEAQAAIGRQPTSNTLSAIAGDLPSPADQAAEILTSTSNSDNEFLSFLFELAGNTDGLMSFDPEIYLPGDDVLDVIQEGFGGELIMRERSDEQLNSRMEQLEAEFNRRLAEQHEQHEQHLQIQQHLEEQILELRRENEPTKSTLHETKRILNEVMKPLRSHFATSTEI